MFHLRHELPLDRCPSCSVNKPRLAVVGRQETADYAGQNKRYWNIYQCSTCVGLVVAYSHQREPEGVIVEIFPKPKVVAEDIPTRARKYLQQALNSLHSPAGAVMLAASAVDAMLKEKQYSKGSLNSRIDQAKKDGLITDDMASWAHRVRLDANEQRHADEGADLPEEDDAKRSIEFALALGEIMFVLPARVTAGIKATDLNTADDTPEHERAATAS